MRAFFYLVTESLSEYLIGVEKQVAFTKMSGAGNDFVVIDNMDGKLDIDRASLAVALCSHRIGIGADGLLLLEPSTQADFSMRYYNADGSYGGMCGNGGRCIARYAVAAGIAPTRMKFEALNHVYSAEVNNKSVKLWMITPNDFRPNVLVKIGDKEFSGNFIHTGSPHFVLEVDDLDSVDVLKIGKAIRNHTMFFPEGCNVNFVSRQGDHLFIRTYERGVENETLACGTGSVASAIVFALQHGLKSPVTLTVRSGEQLSVSFDFEGAKFQNVVLEGSANFIFSGTATHDSESGRISDSLTPNAAAKP